MLGGGQLYVACQTDDDLSYVLRYAGEDSLMIGSDYGHADNASELLALKRLKENGEMEGRVIDKILGWCLATIRYEASNGWLEGDKGSKEWVEARLRWSEYLQSQVAEAG